MSDELNELHRLREQLKLMESLNAQKDAMINSLKEKVEAHQQNVSEHTFTIDLECPAENEQVPNGRVGESEEHELEGVRAGVFATVAINSKGEQQVEVWSKLSCDETFNLTLFAELQLATKAPQSASYNKPICFDLHSELVRIVSGRELQCMRIVVPDWQQKYAVQCRGQTIQLRCRVKIVRNFQSNWEESEDGKEEIEVGGKKISVNLAYLSEWSTEFRSGITSRSKVINEVVGEDFEEMLQVISPSSKPITSWNVEKMLDVASKLKMPELTRRCEVFLNENGKHNLSESQALLLADKYSLQSIKTIVLEKISTAELLRSKVILKDEYNILRPEMKNTIGLRYQELDIKEKTNVKIP